MNPDSSRPYLIAACIVAIAAIAAVGWYVIDRQRPVSEEALEQLEATMLSTTLELKERLETDIDTRQLAEEKARAESDTGVKLAGLCNAWIEFDSNHPSDSTRANRDRACGEYKRYITTGELPASAPDGGSPP